MRRAVVALALFVFALTACELRAPTSPAPDRLLPRRASEPASAEAQRATLVEEARAIVEHYYPSLLVPGATRDSTVGLIVHQGEIIALGLDALRLDHAVSEGEVLRIWPSDDALHVRWAHVLVGDFEAFDPPIERVELSRHPAGTIGAEPITLAWIYLGDD
ncbi:MAG TPA: hypothetical protein VFX29_00380 [Longimicrobiaceae bacterium]|jgi:hypothetical protein|nr:hypothetical protein [Longimicrobiaceae bacterium]